MSPHNWRFGFRDSGRYVHEWIARLYWLLWGRDFLSWAAPDEGLYFLPWCGWSPGYCKDHPLLRNTQGHDLEGSISFLWRAFLRTPVTHVAQGDFLRLHIFCLTSGGLLVGIEGLVLVSRRETRQWAKGKGFQAKGEKEVWKFWSRNQYNMTEENNKVKCHPGKGFGGFFISALSFVGLNFWRS